MKAWLGGMSEPVTTPCCKGGTPTARTSRLMQLSTRPRCARLSCGALRPSTLGERERECCWVFRAGTD
eukprot:2289518-Alexandrium_andersonii.AAC.1